MLEKIVTLFLQKYIGDFLELSKTQLKFGVIRGRIDLKDLKPKLGNLDFFGLPIKVIYESIEHLRFNVPYNHLKTKPTVLEISGVHILFNLLQDKEQKRRKKKKILPKKKKIK
ncbi:vacuolar protein sorting-associated protein 13d [Anaeramoeba flamelloides]|uniref:Vacuolar protein sorting-associated protein 13d n=1 Tax=Anaeramoeba flamelloides TaxID=1746091 RepID=A0ABQ8YUS0_9EUKA|nr:vacuolar protein sorting-associated protein 13d [Anaeramoeba flamelloides]